MNATDMQLYDNPRIKKLVFDIIFYLLIVNIIVVCVIIPYVTIVTSLQIERNILSSPAKFIPNPVEFKNYVSVWTETQLGKNLISGFIVTFSTIALVLIISIPAAYGLSKLNIPGKNMFIILLLFTQMFSQVVVIVPLFQLLRSMNLLDTYTGLILVNTTFSLAFSTLLLISFFDSIHNDILDAAIIDGCGKMQIIYRIILPISTPGIFVVTVYIFTIVWNDFLFAFLFISSASKTTPIVGLFHLIQPSGFILPPWHLAMAFAVLMSIPVILLFYMRKSDMVEGLTAGSIK
jgi:multiple sugar transport system permease protein